MKTKRIKEVVLAKLNKCLEIEFIFVDYYIFSKLLKTIAIKFGECEASPSADLFKYFALCRHLINSC